MIKDLRAIVALLAVLLSLALGALLASADPGTGVEPSNITWDGLDPLNITWE